VQNVTGQLRRLRRLSQTLLLLRRGSVVVTLSIACIAVAIVIDYLLRFPAALRALILLGGLSGLGAALWLYLGPAIAFRPDLTSVALRIERSVPALRGRLASAVEFSMTGVDRENALAARAVAETERRAVGALDGLVRPGPALRHVVVAVGVVALTLLISITQPAFARTGLSRVLLPLSPTEWPARTALVSAMSDDLVAARGLPLALRVDLTMGDPGRTRVTASVRAVRDGVAGPWRGLVMTHQGDGRFERLADTDADALEFSFATDDVVSPTQRVLLVPPPSIHRATLTSEPPAYASSLPAMELELGPGTDARASVATPILIGSSVTLRLELTRPLPVPDESERPQWLRSTLGLADDRTLPDLHAEVVDGRAVWRLAWRMEAQVAMTLSLVDEHGITNLDDIVYRIAAVVDRPPTATIAEPASDESVAPSAVVPVVVEARDDIGVALVGIEVHRHRGASIVELVVDRSEPGSAPAERLTESLSLAAIGARPGDTIVLQGFAEDAFELDGQRHPRARSAERRLRVVGESELAEQLRRDLAGVRQSAIRLDSQQAELAERTNELREAMERAAERAAAAEAGEEGAPDAAAVAEELAALQADANSAARGQAQLGERIAQQERALQELRERVERNQIGDEELEATVELALDRLGQAGTASNQAAEQLEGGEPDAAEEWQREVRDELTGLIEMLDRDEDTWLVTRNLERLQDQMAELREETARLNERTVGQTRDELPAAELSELERIAAAQRDAAEDAARLIEELQRRGAPRDGGQDPQAGVLREAARTAEDRDLEQQMRDAAGEIDANRLANAEQQQANAEATLQEMMDEIRDARRARSRELARQLASLTEAIRQLERAQEDELMALARAENRAHFDERARAMVRLSQNTLGVADEAGGSGPEADRAARLLARAAEAQGNAIRALRQEPSQLQSAVTAEERSLELIREALEASEQAQRRAEEEEARRERDRLIESYREMLNRQSDLRGEVERIAQEGGRRALLETRRAGGQQQQIRERLHEIRVGSEAIAETQLLVSLHERLDGWSRRAEAALERGDTGRPATAPMESIRDSLARIVEALSAEFAEDDPFEDGQGGGDEGGGGGDGGAAADAIPPRAELRLLRGLQEQIYDRTKALDAETDAAWRTEELRDLSERQRELADLAQRMFEALQGAGPTSVGPADAPLPESEP